MAYSQSGDGTKLFFFITWVYYALSPDVHLLEFCLFGCCVHRPCWTWWWVGTKSNEMEKTWHEIKKSIKRWWESDMDMDSENKSYKNNKKKWPQCFWLSSWQVRTFPYKSYLSLLPKRVSKQLQEPWRTSRNWETASWWSMVWGLKPETYFKQSVLFTDPWKYLSINPRTPLRE